MTQSFADQFFIRFIGGLNFGLLLALAAIGAALIYGTTGLSNFAHGEMVTCGAVVALVVSSFWAPAAVDRHHRLGAPGRPARTRCSTRASGDPCDDEGSASCS